MFVSHLIINQNLPEIETISQARRYWLEHYLDPNSSIMQHSYAAKEDRLVPFKFSGRCFDNENEAIRFLKETLTQDMSGGCFFFAAQEPDEKFFKDAKAKEILNLAENIKEHEMILLNNECQRLLKKKLVSCPICGSKISTEFLYKDLRNLFKIGIKMSLPEIKRAEYGLRQDIHNTFESDIESYTMFDCPICHHSHAFISLKSKEQMDKYHIDHLAEVATIFTRCASNRVKTFKLYGDFIME